MKNSKVEEAAKKIVLIIMFFVGFLLFSLSEALANYDLDELLFNLYVPLKGSNLSAVWSILTSCSVVPAFIAGILCFFLYFPAKASIGFFIRFPFWQKAVYFYPFNMIKRVLRKHAKLLLIILLFSGVVYFGCRLNIIFSASGRQKETVLFEREYVDPQKLTFQYPDEKRNLIFIYAESMESTYADTASGGEWNYNLIPQLTQLASDNISFGGEGSLGKMSPMRGATWTMGALVAGTSGLPLKLPIDANGYGEYGPLLPGVCTLNDILDEAGYKQVFMCGSDGSYAGRKEYFEQHGNVYVYDLNEAKECGNLPKDYYVFWGFEDEKLFTYAKEELLQLSQNEEPFNLTLLTVDTHFRDGYFCSVCQNQWETQYENVIACADRQITDFVDWITQQDFYENTTIIIVGDHLSMSYDFFKEHNIKEENQSIYNSFINSAVLPLGDINERRFTMIDIFPSTLAALGITWNGDRAGLGTNLFSGESTLAEKMGISELSSEISLRSTFYNKEFLYP